MFWTCCFLLADADPAFMGNLVYALIALAGLVFGIVGMVSGNKRKPAVSEELYRDYVPRGEFTKAIGEINSRLQEHGDSHAEFVKRDDFAKVVDRLHERFDDFQKHFGTTFSKISESLGQLKGLISRKNHDEG